MSSSFTQQCLQMNLSKMYHRVPITCKVDFVASHGMQDSGAERCPQTGGSRAVGGGAGV